RIDVAGEQPRPEAGDAEPGSLLLSEHDDPDRAARGYPALAQLFDGEQGGHHAERTVVAAAVRYRVEVAPGDDGRAFGRRVAPPRPQVAVGVGPDVEVPIDGLLDEPLPAVEVGAAPGAADVSAVPAHPPDRQQ